LAFAVNKDESLEGDGKSGLNAGFIRGGGT